MILVIEKKDLIGGKRKMRRIMIDEFKIGGLQNFFNYSKINPINIQIKDSEIQNALAFYSSRYKYRFIANNLFYLIDTAGYKCYISNNKRFKRRK